MTTAALPIVALAAAAVAMLLFFRPSYVAIMFGLALPLGAVDLPGGLSMAIAMSILVVAVAMIQRLQRGLLPLPRSWPSLMAVVWSVGVMFSVLLGPTLIKAATFGMWQIFSFLLAVTWPEVAGRAQVFSKALAATLVGGVAVALTGPLMSSGDVEVAFGGAVVSNRPTGIFGQPNEYGLFCMLLVVFAVGIAAATRGRMRWLSLAAAVTGLVGLVVSLSRGSWVGAVGGVAVLLLLMPQARRFFLIGFGVLAASVAAILLSPVQIPYASVVVSRALTINSEGENPYDFRELYRAEGMRLWNESPIFGQGPNSFRELSMGINSVARPSGAEHPHALLLAIGAEQGLLGVAALIGLAGSVALAALFARRPLVAAHRLSLPVDGDKNRSRSRLVPPLPAVVTVSAAAALAAFFVAGIADFAIRNPLSRTAVFLYIGWALAGYRMLRSQGPAAGTSVPVSLDASEGNQAKSTAS